MPRKRPPPNDNFLPDPGQGSDDPEADWLVRLAVVPLRAAYGMATCIARPLWGLVVYLCRGILPGAGRK